MVPYFTKQLEVIVLCEGVKTNYTLPRYTNDLGGKVTLRANLSSISDFSSFSNSLFVFTPSSENLGTFIVTLTLTDDNQVSSISKEYQLLIIVKSLGGYQQYLKQIN